MIVRTWTLDRSEAVSGGGGGGGGGGGHIAYGWLQGVSCHVGA